MQALQRLPAPARANPARHLTNYALHVVTQRTSEMADPRMRALSSVSALESLWVGSRDNHPNPERRPLRRKRGDVHGDLSAVVIRIHKLGERAPYHASGSRPGVF